MLAQRAPVLELAPVITSVAPPRPRSTPVLDLAQLPCGVMLFMASHKFVETFRDVFAKETSLQKAAATAIDCRYELLCHIFRVAHGLQVCPYNRTLR